MELHIALVLIITAGSAHALYPQYRNNRNYYSPKLFVGYNQNGNRIFMQNGVQTVQGQLSNSLQPLPTYRPLTPWNPRANNNSFNSNLQQINTSIQSTNRRITIISGRKTTEIFTLKPINSASSPVTCDYQPNFIFNKINPANRKPNDVLVISANTASIPNTIYDILSNVDSLTSLSKTTNVFIATIPMKNNQPVINANSRIANQKIKDFVAQIPTMKLLDADAMDANLRKYGITWGRQELCKWMRDETARQISGGGLDTSTTVSGSVTTTTKAAVTTTTTTTTKATTTVVGTTVGDAETTEPVVVTTGDSTADTVTTQDTVTTAASEYY